jgi:hypothetical protein
MEEQMSVTFRGFVSFAVATAVFFTTIPSASAAQDSSAPSIHDNAVQPAETKAVAPCSPSSLGADPSGPAEFRLTQPVRDLDCASVGGGGIKDVIPTLSNEELGRLTARALDPRKKKDVVAGDGPNGWWVLGILVLVGGLVIIAKDDNRHPQAQ